MPKISDAPRNRGTDFTLLMARRGQGIKPARRIVAKIGDTVRVFRLDREALPDRKDALESVRGLRHLAVERIQEADHFLAENPNNDDVGELPFTLDSDQGLSDPGAEPDAGMVDPIDWNALGW